MAQVRGAPFVANLGLSRTVPAKRVILSEAGTSRSEVPAQSKAPYSLDNLRRRTKEFSQLFPQLLSRFVVALKMIQ
jgi:hypothetical protein